MEQTFPSKKRLRAKWFRNPLWGPHICCPAHRYRVVVCPSSSFFSTALGDESHVQG
jgi:hypothetical protein